MIAAIVAENALQACATEEQALTAALFSIGASPVDINQVISNVKVYLKQTIRDALANPAKYVQPQPEKKKR